jgi:hypothetical protein
MALRAINVPGGNSYTNDYPTGRLLRDAKLAGNRRRTSEIRRWLIGASCLKKRLSFSRASPAPDHHRRRPLRAFERRCSRLLEHPLGAEARGSRCLWSMSTTSGVKPPAKRSIASDSLA